MRCCSATHLSICGARPRRRRRSPSIFTISPSQLPRAAWACGRPGLCRRPAGGPFTLTVHGSSELRRSDLLVGDVWFASGQSNMEMPLAGFPGQAHITNAAQEIAGADLPQVRLLRMEEKSSDSPAGRYLRRLANLYTRNGKGLFRCRLFFRPRDQQAGTYPHRRHRLFLGRHTDRFLDQP